MTYHPADCRCRACCPYDRRLRVLVIAVGLVVPAILFAAAVVAALALRSLRG